MFSDNGEISGNIKLDLKSDIVIMEFIFPKKEKLDTNYKITWKNRSFGRIDKQFIKIGEEIDFHLSNEDEAYDYGYSEDDVEHCKDQKWQYHVFPLGGLRLLNKKTVALNGALNKVYLKFIAEKVGKYYLTIDNGYLGSNYEIYII
jgi:hypothetical protein